MRYRIGISGDLPDIYLDWIAGLDIPIEKDDSRQEAGISGFTVVLKDQSQLRGILTKLFDLNIEILSLEKDSGPDSEGGGNV